MRRNNWDTMKIYVEELDHARELLEEAANDPSKTMWFLGQASVRLTSAHSGLRHILYNEVEDAE